MKAINYTGKSREWYMETPQPHHVDWTMINYYDAICDLRFLTEALWREIIDIMIFYPKVVQYASVKEKKRDIFLYKDTFLHNPNYLLSFSAYPENTPLPLASINWNTDPRHASSEHCLLSLFQWKISPFPFVFQDLSNKANWLPCNSFYLMVPSLQQGVTWLWFVSFFPPLCSLAN